MINRLFYFSTLMKRFFRFNQFVALEAPAIRHPYDRHTAR